MGHNVANVFNAKLLLLRVFHHNCSIASFTLDKDLGASATNMFEVQFDFE